MNINDLVKSANAEQINADIKADKPPKYDLCCDDPTCNNHISISAHNAAEEVLDSIEAQHGKQFRFLVATMVTTVQMYDGVMKVARGTHYEHSAPYQVAMHALMNKTIHNAGTGMGFDMDSGDFLRVVGPWVHRIAQIHRDAMARMD